MRERRGRGSQTGANRTVPKAMLTKRPGDGPTGAARAPRSCPPQLRAAFLEQVRPRQAGGGSLLRTPGSPSRGGGGEEATLPPGLPQGRWRRSMKAEWTFGAAFSVSPENNPPGARRGVGWRPSGNPGRLLIGPGRVGASRGPGEQQALHCKRLIINALLVLTAHQRREGPALSFRPCGSGSHLGPAGLGNGAMRSRLAPPLLLLLCALLAEGKPNGRRKKGSPGQLLPGRRGPARFEAKFLLYSNRAEQGCLIEPHQEEALQQCPFNASLPLVMIIHGWSVDRRLEGWIWKLAEELKIRLPHSNVVITDWLSLAHAHYPVAVQNTRDIGQEIARFLEWLEETVQFHRSNAHLVGYSLGAHVAGFAGSSMRGNGKIGRITGLDPAGPLFEGMSPTDRLSPDDADFVDAIHTFTQQHMGLSVGIKQPVAHFDFYPNGGTFQPGCHIMHVYNHIVQYGITGLTQTVKCAHERSVHLFIDSLRYSQKQMTGYSCKNMQMFDKGRCLDCRGHRCNTLGYHIQKARVPGSQRFFLKTQPQMPFKVYHYQFKIHFIHEFQEPRIDPTFTISLTGNKDDVENLSITLIKGITQNKTYTFLVPLDVDIGELMMIKLKWEGTAIWENIWDTVQTIIPWRKGDRRPGLIVTSIRVKAGETQQKMTFCSQRVDNLHLYPGHEKMFVRCEVSSQKLK